MCPMRKDQVVSAAALLPAIALATKWAFHEIASDSLNRRSEDYVSMARECEKDLNVKIVIHENAPQNAGSCDDDGVFHVFISKNAHPSGVAHELGHIRDSILRLRNGKSPLRRKQTFFNQYLPPLSTKHFSDYYKDEIAAWAKGKKYYRGDRTIYQKNRRHSLETYRTSHNFSKAALAGMILIGGIALCKRTFTKKK
jgi:hypothetical protein